MCVLSGSLPAQVGVLQIKVLEGDGAVHGAGSRSQRPLLVQVSEETGRPVAGAAVTLHMPEEGPGGVFANGLRTEMAITDANGRARVRGMRLNRTPGRFEIRILAVKGPVRAGAISTQYISTGTVHTAAAAAQGRPRRTWLAVALLAAGAAGAGIAATSLGSSGQVSTTAGPPPAIGAPSITVGKP